MAGFDAILIAPPARQAAGSEAIAAAGGCCLAAFGWTEAEQADDRLGGASVLAIEAEGVEPALLDAALPVLARWIEDAGLQAVVTFDTTQIDAVAARLMLPGVDLLCTPSLTAHVAALAIAGHVASRLALADSVREEEDGEQRRRILEEAERLAAIVIRFADAEQERNGGDRRGGVGDRHIAFGFEPAVQAIDPQAVRQALRARRLRDSFFQNGLFEDPAWDMLLDLFAATLEGQRVSVSSLCIAAAVPPTTALRWMGRLIEAGLLERRPDADDRRRAFISLKPRALAGMEAYGAALRRAGLPFA